MKKISLSNFSIPQNYVLIKPDPDYEFIELPPGSELEINNEPTKIWVGYTSETHGRHFGITGQVLCVPDKLVYNKKRIEKFKKQVGALWNFGDQITVAALMGASMHIDTELEVEVGDKIWFSYLCQINAVVDKLLIDTEEHGICFLAKYEDLYCREREGELELINGWVWIQRIERTRKTESGLELQFSDKNLYENGHAVIVKAAKPLKGYMDGGSDYGLDINGGEQVIYNAAMGHPMEYSMHRKVTEKEVLSIRRKHIYAII